MSRFGLLAGTSSCLVDGFTEQGELRESFSSVDCATGALSALLIGGIIEGIPWAKDQLKGLSDDLFVNGLIKLFADIRPGEVRNSLLELPKGYIFRIYNWKIGGLNLSADNVKALFKIDDTYATEIATKLNSNAVLKKELLESDWWIQIRNSLPDENIRGEFVRDLVDDVNFATTLRKSPYLVRVWEVLHLAGAISLKTDVSWLSKFDNWIVNGVSEAKINKIASELETGTPLTSSLSTEPFATSTLKEGFESGIVNFTAWEKINDGVPSIQNNTSKYYHYLNSPLRFSSGIK